MSQKTQLLTPVGRLVQGSLYEPQKVDAENRPLVYKRGPLAGQPRIEYYFALAIQKRLENSWKQTEWGAKIYEVGKTGFLNGQYENPSFAWKIQDGDDSIPNTKGKKNCDKEGYPGHWILRFSSGHMGQITKDKGSVRLTEKGFINLGDYVQVYALLSDNRSTQRPGIFLNHVVVNFVGYGKRIYLGVDAEKIGFGEAELPEGVSSIPIGDEQQIEPHFGILTAGNELSLPAPTVFLTNKMTPKAQGTYEQYIAAGWDDEQLIAEGFMSA